MKILKEIGFGLWLALISSLMVMGALTLAVSQTERSFKATQSMSEAVLPTAIVTETARMPLQEPSLLPTKKPALAETEEPSPTPEPVQLTGIPTATPEETEESPCTVPGTSTPPDIETPAPTGTFPPLEIPAVTETLSVLCPPPAGWFPYTVQPGDTLDQLSLQYGATPFHVMTANCLFTPELWPGDIIYLPDP